MVETKILPAQFYLLIQGHSLNIEFRFFSVVHQSFSLKHVNDENLYKLRTYTYRNVLYVIETFMVLTYVLHRESTVNNYEGTHIYKAKRPVFKKKYHLCFDKNTRFPLNTFNLISNQIKKQDKMCHNNFDLHVAILVFTSIRQVHSNLFLANFNFLEKCNGQQKSSMFMRHHVFFVPKH